ncbi:hypothetical protein [Novosphingobium sp. JCM 18896]|uniref:hypothetical protein n=1 Tax=Novosphingobium sp. JCM 18896 TaxID=2989731 RepID=UPI00222316D4|nr:hypothetical protein [Novosphingobium sp. JCM 18896]MCW1432175.1 hypothetical protein [Novosphingobium sp. JCM 18896]
MSQRAFDEVGKVIAASVATAIETIDTRLKSFSIGGFQSVHGAILMTCEALPNRSKELSAQASAVEMLLDAQVSFSFQLRLYLRHADAASLPRDFKGSLDGILEIHVSSRAAFSMARQIPWQADSLRRWASRSADDRPASNMEIVASRCAVRTARTSCSASSAEISTPDKARMLRTSSWERENGVIQLPKMSSATSPGVGPPEFRPSL